MPREARSDVENAIVFRGMRLGSREFRRIDEWVECASPRTVEEVARGVCGLFDWRRPNGHFPTRSCRSLLLRLEALGFVRLPPRRRRGNGRQSGRLDAAATDFLAIVGVGGAAVDHQAPLTVRPIAPEERLGWRAYMERYHYLGARPLIGESLSYAAFLGHELVALLGWAAAALHNGPRDRYLGWTPEQKRERLPFVVDNVRFLILPWIQVPHLASRILATNLRRLSADWQAAYGHAVLLAETFVDRARFRGTCYRASNWRYLGETEGFSRKGYVYEAHDRPKLVFIYPLVRRACDRLRTGDGIQITPTRRLMLNVEALPLVGAGGLFEVLQQMTDPRKRRGIRHPLVSVLAVSACAMLTGARSLAAIAQWGAEQSKTTLKRLGSRYGKPPSEPTIRRVFRRIDIVELERRVGEWASKQASCFAGQGIALDGKTVRGSGDGDGKPAHLVSAVLHETAAVVAQYRVPDKTNEIKAVEPVLAELNIEGAVVTGDAMFTQRNIATHVVEDKKADYLFTVKDNQPTLRQAIEDLHLEAFPPGVPDGRQGPRSD
jgi:hypothetical protein